MKRGPAEVGAPAPPPLKATPYPTPHPILHRLFKDVKIIFALKRNRCPSLYCRVSHRNRSLLKA